MAATLSEIEAQALQLTPRERGELAGRLIVSLDGPTDDTPEAIAQAWDEEIARRVAELDAGNAELFSHEQVFADVDEMLRQRGN
jgi:putative addiction module component (TIGR02574 family)